MESVITSCVFCFLLLSVFLCDGFHVLGPPGPLTVQLGDSVMLPCFVETPLSMKELEVEWKRKDSGALVHLWQDGESRPESQDQRYRERAHFFTEEMAHGNFSLFLKNLNREDIGGYKCVVHTNLESDETLIEIREFEHLIVSGASIISANRGEDITLNCSVHSHIPPENIEEVSWRKVEVENILVLLYQEGEVLTDSSHNRYKDRAEFFSTEQRNNGNFSLRLKDVQTEDIGLYICEVFSGALSANTKVEVALGFSYLHIGICFLCTLCVFGLLILSYPAFTYLKSNDNRRPRLIHWVHVLFPNVTMSIAFILWGIDEGFLPEAAICLALNLLRIPCIVWIAPYLENVNEKFNRFIRTSAIPLEYITIIAVAYSSFLMHTAHKVHFDFRVICLYLLLIPLLIILLLSCHACVKGDNEMNRRFPFIQLINLQCILAVISIYKEYWAFVGMAIIILLVMSLSCLQCCLKLKASSLKVTSLCWTSVISICQLAYALGSFYTHYDLVDIVKEREALYCVITFVHILSVMTAFGHPNNISGSDFRTTGRIHSVSCLVVYMLGIVVVVSVNAVALLVKVILKARNVQRSVDLRVILLLTESVFAVCCLILQLPPFWNWIKERTSGIQSGCQLCCRKQTSRDPPSQTNEQQQQQTMNLASEHSGSEKDESPEDCSAL